MNFKKMNIKLAMYLSSVSVGELKREYYIDSETGENKTIFTYFGEIVPKVTLIGRLADRASALSLIMRDLESARKWYANAIEMLPERLGDHTEDMRNYLLLEKKEADNIRPLIVASVVFYGKAFAEANGRKIKAERSWLPEERRVIHDHIIDVRNNFAAHSGSLDYESAETVLLLLPKSKKETIYFPTTIRSQMNMFSHENGFKEVLEHFDYVISLLSEKYHAVFPKFVEFAKGKSRLFWMASAQGNVEVSTDTAKK